MGLGEGELKFHRHYKTPGIFRSYTTRPVTGG
jgi:hypothetical protein